ncbi:hypothetical protein C349_05264 [Cryptococcus neoformans var. grubii Br795]|nr:hypothetical protein C349_05264 [Cryptococcus neoformans var. grubii Br795]
MAQKTRPSEKRIHLTRHAQAEHNVADDYTIADAPLTTLGQEQSRQLNEATKNGVQKTAELLVTSPLRRPLETMLLGYPELKSRLEKSGKHAILLDILQEVGPYPCDTPTHPISALKASNGGIFSSLDFSALSPDYASKEGMFAPANGVARAKLVRKWLRERPEREIVVVAHGDILRYIADGQQSSRPWNNAENKVFTFRSDDDSDDSMVEADYNVEARGATNEPTSSEIKAGKF